MADIQTLTIFFDYVDTDHDGYITVQEIHDACDIDINNDGVIDAAEMAVGSGPWLAAMNLQDLDMDQKISLPELLAYNGLS